MNNNELYHHGILGQRWGVRRFQNYDGTLIKGKGVFSSLGKKKELTPEEQADKEARKQHNAEMRKKAWEGAKKFAQVTYDVAKIAGSIYLAKQLGGIMAMEVISTGNRLATAGTYGQMMSTGINYMNSPEGMQFMNTAMSTIDSANRLVSSPNVTSMYQYASNPQNQQNWINLINTAASAGNSVMTTGAQSYQNMAANTNMDAINQASMAAMQMQQYYQNRAL